MVNIRKIREVVEVPCPCNTQVNQLLSQINAPSQNLGSPNLGNSLQNLGIFDLQNVFVCCLDLQIANNSISITNLNNRNNPPCINSSGQQFRRSQIVSSAGVYVVVGNSQRLGCNIQSNIIYIGGTNNLQRRIGNFIYTLQQRSGSNHEGAKKIREAILNAYVSGNNTCLYIIGFPVANGTIEEWIEVNSRNREFLQRFVEEFFNKLESVLQKLKKLGANTKNIEDKLEKLKKEIKGKISLEEIEKSSLPSLEEIKEEIGKIRTGMSDNAKKEKIKEFEDRIPKILENAKKETAKKDLSEKLEGCFQVIYAYYYDKSPCFVDKMPAADFTIFQSISPAQAKQEIENLLRGIDSTFQTCIQAC